MSLTLQAQVLIFLKSNGSCNHQCLQHDYYCENILDARETDINVLIEGYFGGRTFVKESCDTHYRMGFIASIFVPDVLYLL